MDCVNWEKGLILTYDKGNEMNSFGVWSVKDENGKLATADFHINLWNLKDLQSNVLETFIDIGMLIEDFRGMKKVAILFPFPIQENEIQDLDKEIADVTTARLIFNENCETRSKDKYNSICGTSDGRDKVIINLKKETEELEDYVRLISANRESTIMIVDIQEIDKDEYLADKEDIYIRFRLNTSHIKDMLFCKVKKKNKYLESGFTETQIVDIKINKERNISKDVCYRFRKEKYEFQTFRKINFLIMTAASDEISYMGKNFAECRGLEKSVWRVYLKKEYETSDILAYHWVMKNKENDIREFGELVKITTNTTNWNIIMIYVLIVIVLGAFGSALCNFVSGIRFM